MSHNGAMQFGVCWRESDASSADRRIHKSVSFLEAGMVANVCRGRQSFLQNHLLSYEQLTRPFSMQEPYTSLRDRKTINEDGNRIFRMVRQLP